MMAGTGRFGCRLSSSVVRPSSLRAFLRLQDQLGHAEALAPNEVLNRLPRRELVDVGLAIRSHQAHEDLADDAPADRPKPDWGLIGERLLRLRQDVVPEGRIVSELLVDLNKQRARIARLAGGLLDAQILIRNHL